MTSTVTASTSAPVAAPLANKQLTANQLTAFRARLESDLADAHGLENRMRLDIAAALDSRRSTTNDETDDPEGSNLAFEGAQTNALLGQTSRHSAEIAAALVRIEDGTFGTCVECGTPIAAGRLEARPASALCIECAS